MPKIKQVPESNAFVQKAAGNRVTGGVDGRSRRRFAERILRKELTKKRLDSANKTQAKKSKGFAK